MSMGICAQTLAGKALVLQRAGYICKFERPRFGHAYAESMLKHAFWGAVSTSDVLSSFSMPDIVWDR
eukprot:1160870-Pelagomonas_calceolata.AAC.6